MAEITVIMPVYRVEAFLREAVDSVLHQTFSDFRLILVEDGSPDGCGRICDEYAARDSRVTVIHQENRGQAAARNRALGITDSPWICFVDSDDLIHPQTLELLYRAAGATDVPMSMCNMLESPELPEHFCAPVEPEIQMVSISDSTLARMLDEGTYPAWVSCGKLIRRELVESYLFCPGRVYEDNEAVCRWVAAAGKLAQIHADLYFYRTNPGSTTQREFSLKKLDYLWALESIIHFYGGLGFEMTCDRFFDRYVVETGTCWRMVHDALKLPREAKKLKKNLRRLIRQEKRSLSTEQFEYLLDAIHPKLIKAYWPVAGAVRTLRQDGLAGVVKKLKKHVGGERP